MASIRKEIVIAAPAAAVWDAIQDIGAIHTRVAPGFVTNTTLEDGGGIRVVTFSDGLVLRERIISVDDDSRRLVWSVVAGPFEHHNASAQVIGDDQGCRVVWTADLLPNELADTVAEIMERGLGLTKQTQEAATASTRAIQSQLGELDPNQYVFCPASRPTLHHVSLFVADMEASTRFYTVGLGLTVREEFRDIVGKRASGEFPFGVASVFLEAGDGRYVELHPAGQWPMSPPGFPLNHLALGVTDVDAAYTRALAAGGTPTDIPVPEQRWDGTPLDVIMSGDHPEPMRMALVLGPSRELIELYQATTAN
ncbi:SRPBCC family protein [Gimesia aquarii]|uniref:Polyketide cyclase / dehydrase and lipid transport n=1 Tax=Gimesia aquarii TaxID=2527964 RepID=A0A517WQH2_9PLAN|nr:SRPBCC family protein [Gimesia aquarii]QDU07511.1 Polyketide cyclase / dehydrase and lipid transport [Gimesia aquarii]